VVINFARKFIFALLHWICSVSPLLIGERLLAAASRVATRPSAPLAVHAVITARSATFNQTSDGLDRLGWCRHPSLFGSPLRSFLAVFAAIRPATSASRVRNSLNLSSGARATLLRRLGSTFFGAKEAGRNNRFSRVLLLLNQTDCTTAQLKTRI
jgi:hypothetical protein